MVILPASPAIAANIDTAYKYAWSNQVGYVNFDQVTVSSYGLTGYAWSTNTGWISMSPSPGGVRNDNAGHLSGYAWGTGLGWINFDGVTIDTSTGKFSGTATGDLVGTLTFDCPTYCDVRTSWRPTHSGGGGGGGGGAVSPSLTVSIPNGGAAYDTGSQLGIAWSSANGTFVKYRILYSADNGGSWAVITEGVANTFYTWTVPTVSTSQGLIKVEGLDSAGSILAADVSNAVFTVVGTTTVPPPVAPPATAPPTVDSTIAGVYSAALALVNTPDITIDKGLVAPPAGTAIDCTAGTLIKGSLSAVYFCGADGKRYVFANEKVYLSWYVDFATVQTIPDQTLAQIALGGNVTYRPGAKLVKIQTDPKVYAVSRGGTLRWITTEVIAARLYGADWNKLIDDIPDSFFVNYKVGEPISE